MCRFFDQNNVRGSCFESTKHFANFDIEASFNVGIDNNPFLSSKIRKQFCMILGMKSSVEDLEGS